MLKDVINLVLCALPGWLILFLDMHDRLEEKPKKRADDAEE